MAVLQAAPCGPPPEQHAAAGLAAIVGKLQGLKPFPESAQRLLLVLWDPEHESSEVVKIIERDPTLTAPEVAALVEFIRTSRRGVILRRPTRRAEELVAEE